VLRVAGAQGLWAFRAYCLVSAINCKRLASLFTPPEKQGRLAAGKVAFRFEGVTAALNLTDGAVLHGSRWVQ
jgi:hypothetical protein